MVRVVVGILALVSVMGAAALGLSSGTPGLTFDESVPPDLQALAGTTWDDFLAAHSARVSCLEPLTLSADWDLGTRGEYLPEARTAVVRIPGTAATLRNQLVHEFAHHVEFTCPAQQELRAFFLDAQGFPPSAGWFEGETWGTTPSEQYAEATIEVVLGRRVHHGNVRISHEAVAAVDRWARGG